MRMIIRASDHLPNAASEMKTTVHAATTAAPVTIATHARGAAEKILIRGLMLDIQPTVAAADSKPW